MFRFLKKKPQTDTNKLKKILLLLLLFAWTAFSLELTLFNYKAYATRANKTVSSDYVIGDGLLYMDGNRYIVQSTENCFLSFSDFSSHISSLRVNIDRYDMYDEKMQATTVTVFANDDANTQLLQLGSREVIGAVKASQYMKLHLKGTSDYLMVNILADVGDEIFIHDIELNPPIPVIFHAWRAFCVFCIMVLLYMFRPDSCIYRYKFSRKSKVQRLITAIFIFSASILFVKLAMSNPDYKEPKWDHHKQYQELAAALSKGHFYLDVQPPEVLQELENPYDTNAAYQALAGSEETLLWDHVYFEGKYYVYFGIVPELLFYYPYYMVTHKDFNTVLAIIIGGVLLIIALSQLIRIILEKWFPDTSFGMYLLLTGLFVSSTGLLYIGSHPDFYDLPILMALVFASFGVYFWIAALQDHKVHGIYLTLGSLCMALIAGCRPQLVLLSFIAVPLFMRKIIQEKVLFTKATWIKTISAFLPFVFVASGIMYYNYARFGSVFEFGAKYNLTVSDMTNRIRSMQLSIAGMFLYFLQPMNVGLKFPFLYPTMTNFSYLGSNYYEAMYGGILLANPILFLLLKLKENRNRLKKGNIWGTTIFLLLFAFGIAFFDIMEGGILPRYLSDFSLFLFLGAMICILAMNEKYAVCGGKKQKRWRKTVVMLASCSMVYHVFMIFANETTYLSTANAELYYKICYGVQFWL